MSRARDSNLDPASWTVEEVSEFLEINECVSLLDAFAEQVIMAHFDFLIILMLLNSVRYIRLQSIDGSKFMALTKPDIMKLVNNKIGPCLKVENLISLLKARLNPAQARFQTAMRKST